MSNTGVPYTIQDGDNLWNLAATHLGDPYQWPRLFAFNNQPKVVAAGARKIVDPDLIYAGARLHLPILPQQPPVSPMPSAVRPPAPGPLRDQIPSIRMPVTFAYDLKGDPIVIDYGTFVARVSISGRVILALGEKMPLTAVLNGGLELTGKAAADHAFGTLTSQNTVRFDPTTKEIKFSNKLISSSNLPGAPRTAIGMEFSTMTGMPVLKGEIIYPELSGRLGNDTFVAGNYKINIEIEPRVPKGPAAPQPVWQPVWQPVPQPVLPSPVRAPIPDHGTDWGEVARNAGTGALVVAGVVTVAYGLSLFFSGGTTSVGAPAYASAMSVILVGGTTTAIMVNQ